MIILEPSIFHLLSGITTRENLVTSKQTLWGLPLEGPEPFYPFDLPRSFWRRLSNFPVGKVGSQYMVVLNLEKVNCITAETKTFMIFGLHF